MTPAHWKGFVEGERYRITTKHHGGTIRFMDETNIGDVITFQVDDGTWNPIFIMENGRMVCPHIDNLKHESEEDSNVQKVLTDWTSILTDITIGKTYEIDQGGMFVDDGGDTRDSKYGKWIDVVEGSTPAARKGLKVGDLVVLTKEDEDGEIGDVMRLVTDDGTFMPFFEVFDRTTKRKAPVTLGCVRKLDPSDKLVAIPPMDGTAITKGKEYPVRSLSQSGFYTRGDGGEELFCLIDGCAHLRTYGCWKLRLGEVTPCAEMDLHEGDVVSIIDPTGALQLTKCVARLTNDDGSDRPRFKILEGPRMGDSLWLPISFVEKDSLTGKAKKRSFDEHKAEGVFDMTPAQQHGLKVGDKVRVVNGGMSTRVGQVLTLINDDNSHLPYFLNESGETVIAGLANVTKIEGREASPQEEQDETAPNLESVRIGGPVKCGDIITLNNGSVQVVDCDYDRPDSDNEYSTHLGYAKVGQIRSIHRAVPQKQDLEVTVTLSPEDIEALREAYEDLTSYEIAGSYDRETRQRWVEILERLHEQSEA